MSRTLLFLLPYRRFQISSRLSAAEASEVLAAEIEPRRWLRFTWRTRAFEGSVEGSSFDIRRIIRYRNSFVPRVLGTIQAEPNGCTIVVEMTLAPVVLIVMLVWFGIGIFDGFSSLATAGTNGNSGGTWARPVAMLAFGWLLMIGGFAFEAHKAKRLLTKTFLRPAPCTP